MAKIVVSGGNGFIGSEICRLAVTNGHDVAAFARRGRPSLSPARHPWTQEVEWRAADVFEPSAWRDLLENAEAVIHCIATIQEDPKRNITYERVNGDAAVLAAGEAAEAGADSFVFFSVRDKPPLIDRSFLTSKRRAEQEISESHPDLRFVGLRPNLVFGSQKKGSSTLAALLDTLQDVEPHPYASLKGRPLPVELVAAAALHAAVEPTVEGTLSVDQIEDLGRTSGLVPIDEVSEASLMPLLAGTSATVAGLWLLQRLFRR